jgi:4-hydroxy-tetrahydrodipicolinate synthase
MFTGTYTAIVTPFKNGLLDEAALKRLVKNQIKGGVDGIVPVGTTGESPTVDYDEHIRIIELCVKFAAGKIKVLAGTGGNSTSEAIYLTSRRKSRRGRFAAGRALLQQADAGRLVSSISRRWREQHQTAHRSLQHSRTLRHRDRRADGETPRRRRAKTSSASRKLAATADRVSQLRAALGPKFEILSGDDSLTLPFMAVGARGVISVASNVIPARSFATW